MTRLAKYGEAYTYEFAIPIAGSTSLAESGDWTPASGDVKISKDGGNVANSTNLPSAVGGTGSILWKHTLSATEMQAARIVIQIDDAAVEQQVIVIETYGHASARHAFDLDQATPSVNMTQVSGDSTAADNLESACDNYSATRGLAGTALPDAAADAGGGLAISDAGGLDIDTLLGRLDAAISTRSSHTAANVRTEMDANSTQLAAILLDTGTTLDGKIDTIDGIVDAIKAKTDPIVTVAGRVISYVEDMEDGVIVAATLADDAINDNNLSAEAAEKIRDAVLDRVLNGNHDTPGTTGEVLQAILGDTGTDGVVVSVAQVQSIADEILKRGVSNVEDTANTSSLAALILGALHSSISSTTWTIKKTDDSTTFDTKTLTEDATANPKTGVSG